MSSASLNHVRYVVVLDQIHSLLLNLINKPERFVGCERKLLSTRTMLGAIVLTTKRKVLKGNLKADEDVV